MKLSGSHVNLFGAITTLMAAMYHYHPWQATVVVNGQTRDFKTASLLKIFASGGDP